MTETFGIQRPNAENRLRLKLFKELDTLDPCCVYSGQRINPSELFTNRYQIDHILPFSKTLDDSYNNKVLVTHDANADKADRSVWDLAQSSRYDWEAIQERAASFVYAKRKRFAKDALQDWLGNTGEFTTDGAGFLQRQLTDTAYLSRVTREYLQTVCPANKIVSSPGRLTAMLRAKWGLNKLLNDYNSKNRNDHRHHTIDAALIGIIDRSLLKRVADRAKHFEEISEENLFKGIDTDLPWECFRDELANLIIRCTVSHKPDHNPRTQLHEATAMGLVEVVDQDKGRYVARKRVALSSLTEKNLRAAPGSHHSLQDAALADALLRATYGLSGDSLKEKLAQLEQDPVWPNKAALLQRISSGGVAVELKGTAISPDPRKRPPLSAKLFKGGANYCYELFVKENDEWDGELITSFIANQEPYQAFMRDSARFNTHTFTGKPLLMRLIINDMVILEFIKGAKRLTRVHKMSEGKIVLCDHFEANVAERHIDKSDPFNFRDRAPSRLKALRARRAKVDILGRISDPGFND